MRPIRLEFEAFGPFPGTEVVDFVSLDDLGLYLVSGPTGAGKTSIYDAMVFALYGKVPGARSDNTLRSDFATADATAAVNIGNRVDTGTWFQNRCDYLDPALAWTGSSSRGAAVPCRRSATSI